MDSKTRLWRERELSKEKGIPVKTLQNDRLTNQRIPFIKIGRSVFYDPVVVEAAIARMTFPKRRAAK